MRYQDAITKWDRLFNKNVTVREPVKVCMGRDVCPVPVSQIPFQLTLLKKALTEKR